MRRALLLMAMAACAADDATPHARSEQCTPCHLADFESAPGHAGERPTTCAVCHGQDKWVPSALDHPWPLAGAHAKASCFDCHSGTPPLFEGTSNQCFSCHQASFEHAVELYPWHAPFSHDCTKCHTTAAWKPALPHEKPPPKKPPPTLPPPPAPTPTGVASTPKPRPWPRPIPTAQPTTQPTVDPQPQPQPPDPLPDVTTQPSR